MILDNAWWKWFLENFSFSIFLLWVLLQALAVLHPGTPTDKVVDFIRNMVTRKAKE